MARESLASGCFQSGLSPELQRKLVEHLNWCKTEDKTEALRFLALATCGEAGELANLIKKDWRGDSGQEARAEKIDKEIVDLGNYVFMMAFLRGIDLPFAMMEKMIEVEERPETPWSNR
jgi:NTP pyrophosphatase (non-canonical NTP hydrolase)